MELDGVTAQVEVLAGFRKVLLHVSGDAEIVLWDAHGSLEDYLKLFFGAKGGLSVDYLYGFFAGLAEDFFEVFGGFVRAGWRPWSGRRTEGIPARSV